MKNYFVSVDRNGNTCIACLKEKLDTHLEILLNNQTITENIDVTLEEALDMISRDHTEEIITKNNLVRTQ